MDMSILAWHGLGQSQVWEDTVRECLPISGSSVIFHRCIVTTTSGWQSCDTPSTEQRTKGRHRSSQASSHGLLSDLMKLTEQKGYQRFTEANSWLKLFRRTSLTTSIKALLDYSDVIVFWNFFTRKSRNEESCFLSPRDRLDSYKLFQAIQNCQLKNYKT